MKLLFVAPYVYAPMHKAHSKNKTGFGFMVYDIASEVGKQGGEVVLTTHTFGPQCSCQSFEIAANSLWKTLLFGRYKGLLRFCLGLKRSGASVKEMVRGAYYYLGLGYTCHLIKKEKPDAVHIHGCSVETEVLVSILRKMGVPHVLTLHGLLQDDLGASRYLKNCECNLVKTGQTPITVISSKMKERFLSNYYAAKSVENVHVITNGISVNCREETGNFREELGISEEQKIILSVGSVCELKNQSQTARAFARLPKEQRDECVLLFAGTVHENAPAIKEIEALQLGAQIRCLGFVPREDLGNYYRAADLTVTASLAEGFGLPIIEGFVYGTPCVAFSDLDAIGDIYDESAMLLCRERSDEALANAMAAALSTLWDQEKIKAHSKNFSLEEMARKYQAVYEKIAY